MKNNDLWNAIGDIDDRFIEEAAPKKRVAYGKRIIARCVLVAACLAFVISVCIGAFAVAAEAKEYKEAVEFFDQYSMSTEGLTRTEIKAVYKDIVTNSFTYSKTAEVIRNSMTNDTVSGFEIDQDDPTPEDVAKLWNSKNNSLNRLSGSADGIRYKAGFENKTNEYGNETFDKSFIEKYDGDTLLWSTEMPDFYIVEYRATSDGVIIYGDVYKRSSSYDYEKRIVKIGSDGKIMWNNLLYNVGVKSEYFAAFLEEKDGSITVFSVGDRYYLCLTRYSKDGLKIGFSKTEIGDYGVFKVVSFCDGYLVHLRNNIGNKHARIVKVDNEGCVTSAFDYSSEEVDYHITDMIEYNGKIYLSAYATPKPSDKDKSYGSRAEIARILDYAFSKEAYEIPSEELTPVIRDNYTAILLVCDPNEGTPKEFYSVKGSLGGELSLSDTGNLLWNVESIATTFFSPATSSYTIWGTCNVFRYTFDDNGTLIRQEKTDEIVSFVR